MWSAALPGHGAATPIIWGDRVFVSSTDPAANAVVAICVSAADGKILWQTRLGDDAKAPNNDMATPSPCTDGQRVYFLTGSGDLAALDFAGKVLWSRNLVKEFGNTCIKYGYSSSPLLLGGKLYIEMVRRAKPYVGVPGIEGTLEPFVLAVDVATGKDVWRQIRPSDADDESLEAYTTPLPFQAGGRAEVLVLGGDYLTGHDPETGKESWRLTYNKTHTGKWRLVAGPVAWEDLVFMIQPRGNHVMAAKIGGKGLLPDSVVVWTSEGRASDSATPLVYQNLLYMLDSDAKAMTCFEPRTGKSLWRGALGGTAWRASPTGADGKIFCLSMDGEVAVLAAGNEFKILSRTTLGDGQTQSSIAVAGGRVYVRTVHTLHSFGKPAAKP
jgi:outer membrane protein assembly factor BamB